MENIRGIVTGIEHIRSPDIVVGKMEELKRKYQLLESKKDDIEQELKNEVESSSRKRPRKEVLKWIENVQSKKTKVEELEQEVSTSTYLERFTKITEGKVDSLTREVTELTEQSKFERGRLTIETYGNEGLLFPTEPLIGETFEENKKRILDCLKGEGDSIVGVYGMGGVGKTTLIKHIHNELQRHPDFRVYWVTVSQNFSVQKLQNDIARKIDFDFSGEDDEMIRAAMLAEALKRRDSKKLILIFDDVWENISLRDVGIIVGENVWKLLLTSRSVTVCRNLECNRTIKVEPLSEGEAWTLFAKTLNNEALLSDHRIKEIAESLVRECAGLPLGITVMAGSMRGVDDIHEWRNALEEIREAKYSNNVTEFYDNVFLVLRYSYDKLKDSKLQKCLLCCSLFPEDELIRRDELIEYFIDEKLLDRMNSRQSLLDEGHTVLKTLEKVCLLEGCTGDFKEECVKMHDLVRDMAIKIASDNPYRFLVQAGMGLTDLPNEEEWPEDRLKVSLMHNKISHIPSNVSPRCPELLTLLLQHNHDLKVIPDNLFMHMKMLTLLNLSNTRIKSLPTSIANLKSLTVLLLRGCQMLRYVPSLENLTLLRKLDLYKTAIEELPKGMEKLINLRYLCLEKCWNLKMIPEGIFCQLSEMEWFSSDSSLSLRAEEIGSWRKLETFSGNFGDFGNLNTIVRLWEERGPTKYTTFVGLSPREYAVSDNYAFDKQVVVVENEDTEDTFALPSSTESLHLECCNGIRSLSHIALLRKANNLRKCSITECNNMSHVVCSCRTCGNAPFSHCLEILRLWNLPMLTDLVERNMGSSYSSSTSVVPNNIFISSLKVLIIKLCHKLECLFSPAMLPAFRCLEELEVRDCSELVEIVRDERIREDEDQHEDATTTTILSLPPNLKLLTLYKLPKLKSFCSSSIKLSDLPMLTDLVERNMGSSYSSSTSVVPNNIFSSLKVLNIENCDKLECLFTPAMLPALRCLEELDVSYCSELVEIVVRDERIREDEDQHEDATTTTILSLPPNLKSLKLSFLPKLKSFCSSSIKLSDLPMLTDLVERNMGSSYSSSTSVVPNNIFSSLKELNIGWCDKLECLFTPAMLPALRFLEELDVARCDELVEIVRDERIREDEDQHEDATTTTILSLPPNLKRVSLFCLPKLKSFCSSSIKLSDSLRKVEIFKCPELKRITLLWDEPHPPTNIEQVRVVPKEWWDSVEWKHPQTKAVLQPFLQ